MKKGFAALAVVGVAAAIAVFAFTQAPTGLCMNLHSSESTFQQYLAKHGKSYGTKEEYEFRKAIYMQEMEEINLHNSQNSHTWSKAINKFSDWTTAEL